MAATLIATEEIPLRSGAGDRQAIETILRRGAIVGREIEHHGQARRTMEQARALIAACEERDESLDRKSVV